MALLFFDGFDNYSNAADMSAVVNPYVSDVYPNGGEVNSYAGRRGTYGWRVWSTGGWIIWTFNSTYTTFIIGFAIMRLNGTPGFSGYDDGFLEFRDAGTAQLKIYGIDTELRVYDGDDNPLGTSSGCGFGTNIWRYIEVKVTIDSSVGAVEIKSNGTTVLNLTNQDTQKTANAYFNSIKMTGMYSGITTYMDDLYMLDTTGSKNNDFLGDVKVDTLRPNAAGTYSDFTPSAGNNYENVDESPGPDDDTTYNDGSNIGDQDTYNLESLPSPSGTTIHGVKSSIVVKKTDASSREIKVLTRSGTTDHLGNTFSLGDTYNSVNDIMEDNPDDSNDWEDADINALQVGLEITA